MKVIDNRRSVRKFSNQEVDQVIVEKLLRAAMQAPSAGNQQPWEFIVVEDKVKLEELSNMSPYATPVKRSAVSIVVLGNRSTK